MQFNPSSGVQGLTHQIWYETGTDATSFPVADITRILNIKLRKYGLLAWSLSNQWRPEDANQTTLTFPTFDLVDGQEDYALPTTVFDINAISVKDSGGLFSRLTYFDVNTLDVSLAEWNKTKGIPRFYTLIGQTLILKPAPSATEVTLTGGMELDVARDISEIAITDSTKELGFPTIIQPLFTYEVASEFPALDEKKEAKILNELAQWRQLFTAYYTKKGKEIKKRITVRKTNLE